MNHQLGSGESLHNLPSGISGQGLPASGIDGSSQPFMVGNSAAMRTVFEQIRRFADCDMPVLISGESGTGKELAARAIHERSRRARGPYVAVNCAAIPAPLFASELFGYEKGAFSGANSRQPGQIERAHKGTLLLDDIGDMPADLQGHLLRFLQEGEIVRVGGHEPVKVEVRIVAASNTRLRGAVTAGKFREDLYYRLNVLSLLMPPLRDREGDVELLASHFLRQIGQELGRPLRSLTPGAFAALRAHSWPGNVRELIATLRRAAVLADGDQITDADLRTDEPAPVASQPGSVATRDDRPIRLIRASAGSPEERQAVMTALQDHKFNITTASRALGISRVTFYRMLERNQIELRHQCVVQPAAAGLP